MKELYFRAAKVVETFILLGYFLHSSHVKILLSGTICIKKKITDSVASLAFSQTQQLSNELISRNVTLVRGQL